MVTNQLEHLVNMSFEKISKPFERGQALSFGELETGFKYIQETASRLLEINLDAIPQELLSVLENATNQLLTAIGRLETFQHLNERAQHLRSSILANYKETVTPFLSSASTILALSIGQNKIDSKLKMFRVEIEDKLKSELKEYPEIKEKAEIALRDINQIVIRAKNELGKHTVSIHADHFRKEARYQIIQGAVWLACSLIALFAISYWGLHLYKKSYEPAQLTTYGNVQLIFSKIIITSTLFTVLYGCLKNFKSCNHNIVVNRHRANALSTFDTFVNSAADQATKDAILLQSASCVFSPQNSGYTEGSDSETSNNVFKIVESVGSIAKPTS